jgi:hypothetical protein
MTRAGRNMQISDLRKPSFLRNRCLPGAVWKIKLVNNGPDAVQSIAVTENPGELTLVENGADASKGSFEDLVWSIPELASRESVTLTLKTTIPEDAEKGEELKNCAAITSPDQHLPDTDTNMAGEVCVPVKISPTREILDITIKPETLKLGSRGFFTVFVRLSGDPPLSEINLKDSTLFCNNVEASKLKMSQKDGGTVIAKFRRQEFADKLADDGVAKGEITVTCVGTFSIGDKTVTVTGSDTIRVIGKKKKGFDRFWCDVLDTVLPTTEDDGEVSAENEAAAATTPAVSREQARDREQLRERDQTRDQCCSGDCTAAGVQGCPANAGNPGNGNQNSVTGSLGKGKQGDGNDNPADTGKGNGNGKGNSNRPDTEKGNGNNKN